MKKTQTTYKLLALLCDGQFHSGEALGDSLGMSRSAIWKAVKQLIEYGIHIESTSGKGYRIPYGLELLDENKIKAELSDSAKSHLNNLILLNDIDSTNDYLLEINKTSSDKTVACFAEYQTHGKGRRGRKWVAPFGTNIYHSLLWHFNKDPAEIVGLSLAIAVATAKALQHYGVHKGLHLKWPNDILWNGRKIGGILLEMHAEHHDYSSVVIGVGVNTFMPVNYAKDITQPWIDIHQITKATPLRNKLAGLLLNELIKASLLFEKEGLAPFLKTWKTFDQMIGKSVYLDTPQGKIHGVMKGVSERGELILLCNNQERHFLSGELSLRLEE